MHQLATGLNGQHLTFKNKKGKQPTTNTFIHTTEIWPVVDIPQRRHKMGSSPNSEMQGVFGRKPTCGRTAIWPPHRAPPRRSSATRRSKACRCPRPRASWTECPTWSGARWSPGHTCPLWGQNTEKMVHFGKGSHHDGCMYPQPVQNIWELVRVQIITLLEWIWMTQNTVFYQYYDSL